MALALPTRVGPYEIVAILGTGGMGEVYRARDTRLRREAAIKILPAEFSQNADRLKRFEREAQSASALSHPSIITIYDIGSAGSLAYIAMELVDGKTLREMLGSGPLAIRTILKIAAQMSEGLAKAHAAGIIHRDLKPENVMVTKDGFVKILDFGLAKLAYSDSLRDQETETQPGTIVGTVAYMSPEQAAGKSIDFRSDQFSFGSILYEMISGKKPFPRRSSAETLSAIINDEPEPLNLLNPQTPAPLDWVNKRCMAKEAQDRYESTRDLAKDLQTIRDHFTGAGTSASGGVSPRPISSWRKLFPILAATLIISIIVVAFLTVRFLAQKNASRIIANKQATALFSLRQLTFRHGYIRHARFAPDGQTIIYDAGWNGNRPEIFFSQIGNPESRSLGMKDTELQSVSAKGDMAILLHDRRNASNTLARVLFSGGAPRPLAENVSGADWSPNGNDLVLIHGAKVLESPIGKQLYKSKHFVQSPRFSPKGDLIAFVELRFPGNSAICITDRSGNVRRLYEYEIIRPESAPGLAWAPSGDEIWFTAISQNGTGLAIHAVTLSGRHREILPLPGLIHILDISNNGRVLLAQGTSTTGLVYFSAEDEKERDLSWLDGSNISDLSEDGKTILFTELEAAGKFQRSVYLRRVDEQEAVRLADGFALGLSPDGRWALTFLNNSLILRPTGPGQSRTLNSLKLDHGVAYWFPDGKRVLFYLSQFDHARLYVQQIDQTNPRAISPEGIWAWGQRVISPDGKWVIADSKEGYFLYSIDDGKHKAIPSLEPDDSPICWNQNGRSIYVDDGTATPTRIIRIELSTGHRELFKEIAFSDPAGVNYTNVMLTPDGKTYAYTYGRLLTDLYLVEGLK